MKLDANILNNETSIFNEEYHGIHGALGLYDSMQFVLRLRYDLHYDIKKLHENIEHGNNISSKELQAYSTYFHETIHWWQHIGSISGLILSLSSPAQSHINHNHLKNYKKHTGLIKSIKKYNELNMNSINPSDDEFKTINSILNNFYDIEFFKEIVISPKNANKVVNDKLFESVGHSSYITYIAINGLLSDTFDEKNLLFSKASEMKRKLDQLKESRIEGYYYGSPVRLAPLGVKDLYEGQARFLQMQFLFFSSGNTLTWKNFESLGMLSGIYYSAFSDFLEATKSTRPESLDDPVVALFLLVIDISINPAEGFPFEIETPELFCEFTNPGMRFLLLCNEIRENHSYLKDYIKSYSSNEYDKVSRILSKSISSPSPIDISEKVLTWVKEHEEISKLMKEEKTFDFEEKNLPIRLILSRFIRFQQDRVNRPEFFCWAGFYNAGENISQENQRLFMEHQSLFEDGEDGDIYPRLFSDKDDSIVQKTFDKFYIWLVAYDLTRQWIIGEDDFNYDYFWLTSKYSMKELEDWAKIIFINSFEVSPDDFVNI